MDEPGVDLPASHSEIANSESVREIGGQRLFLGDIHLIVSGGIDDHGRIDLCQRALHPGSVADVDSRSIQTGHSEAAALKLVDQFNPELPTTPENNDTLCVHSSGRIATHSACPGGGPEKSAYGTCYDLKLRSLREFSEEVLTWTRPDFLALRYELLCPDGIVAKVSVSGMGDSKHALGETAEGAWRFEVFPFASDNVVITKAEDRVEAGSYARRPPFEIRLIGGALYRLNPPRLEAEDGRTVFSYEHVESFPRWKNEIRLGAEAVGIAELPLLVVSACCIQVFR